MSLKTVAKTAFVASFFVVSALQIRANLVKVAYGDEPLTAPLTSPITPTDTLTPTPTDAPLTSPVTTTPTPTDAPLTAPESGDETTPSVTPTTSPTLSPSPVSTPSNNGSHTSQSNTSGSGSNTNTTSAICGATKPVNAPLLLQVVQTGKDKVTLFWKKSDGPVTGNIVSFGPKNDRYIYATGTIGNEMTTTYTINNLGENQTYFFRMLAVNNCQPSEYSNALKIALNSRVFRSTKYIQSFAPSHSATTFQTPTSANTGGSQPVNEQNPVMQTQKKASFFSAIKNIFSQLFGK